MNQDPRGGGLPRPGDQRGRQNGGRPSAGSVRRAREMAQAGLPLDRPSRPSEREAIPIIMPQSMNNRSEDRPRQTNPGRRQGNMPAALSNARTNPSTVGQAISKPAPMAQWPLPEDNVSRGNMLSPSDDRNAGRGPTPQRPPRPSNVPSLLDSSKIREYSPSMPYNQQQQAVRPPPQGQMSRYWEDDEQSSIPDFPVPAAPPPAAIAQRKGGPPPTTRRGPSSHYSAITHVSPIPEERDSRRGTDSFASSHVIPSSWGSNSPDGEFDEDDYMNSKYVEHDEGAGLVRQASLGQRSKPTLRTIKSSEDTSGQGNGMQKYNNGKIGNGGIVAQAAVAAGAGAGAVAAGLGASRYEMPPVKSVPNPGRTIFLNASSSSCSSPLSAEIDFEKREVAPRSPASPPINPRIAQLAGGLEKGKEFLGANPPAMSDRIPGTRRPPRLDLDAVKDAEARGSLTSLPDLIKRATRLAANLDRGKTASRVGMLDLFKYETASSGKGESPSERRPRSGSISDILASFPPPGLATPTGERPASRWPSPFPVSPSRLIYHETPPDTPTTANLSDVHKKPKRKCCGMPLWAFVLVCIILILLVAAAVVVPVTLIVLPRQQQASKTSSDSCSSSTACSNGGVSVISGDACRCVCVNGFTGDRCTISGDLGCTTTDISNGTPSTFKNATIGSSIPRLLSGSSANYSIPLNSSALLALFSSNNLSCSSENALVTFNGNAQKRSLPLLDETEAEANRLFANPKPTPTGVVHDLLFPRQDPAATSNGIVFAATSTTGAPAATQAPSSNTDTANANTDPNSSSTTNTTTQAIFVDAQTTDFARIVILFILQQTGNLTSAVRSQERIQGFFQQSTPNATMNGDYSGGDDPSLDFTIDFGNFSIALANGTVVGGRGPSPSATPTPSVNASGTAKARRGSWKGQNVGGGLD